MDYSTLTDDELRRQYVDVNKQIVLQHTLQLALKTSANSNFGAMAQQGFLFFDTRLAAAITDSGRFIIQHVANHVDKRLNELFKTDNIVYQRYSDTDSIFFDMSRVVKKYYSERSDLEIVSALDKLMETVVSKFINEATDSIAIQQNFYKKTIFFKREKICSSGFFCVHPSTNISTINGDINVVDLFNSVNSDDDIRKVDVNCVSTSPNGLQIDDSITHVMRKYYSGDMYTITNDDGKQINVTEDHQIMISRDGTLVWIKAKNLIETDVIVALNTINSKRQYNDRSGN